MSFDPHPSAASGATGTPASIPDASDLGIELADRHGADADADRDFLVQYANARVDVPYLPESAEAAVIALAVRALPDAVVAAFAAGLRASS